MTGLIAPLIGSLAIAAVSTLGDFIWATWISTPGPIYGIGHGTILFLCIGLFLGTLAGRPRNGASGGALIGGLAAASFYVLAPFVGGSIMFVMWTAVWMALGMLTGHLYRQRMTRGVVLARGAFAAIASGLAFYLISGIWFPFDPRGWDYLVHFGAWTLAYLPGFAALLFAYRSA
jgi:hypothetical protein